MGLDSLVARMLLSSFGLRAAWTFTDWAMLGRLAALVALPTSLVWMAEEASPIRDAGLLSALPCGLLCLRIAHGWRSNRRWRSAWRLP